MAEYLQGRDGRFAGSIGDGKHKTPQAPGRPASAYEDNPIIKAELSTVLTTWEYWLRSLKPSDDPGTSGVHPIYGGETWGIHQEHGATFVNHGFDAEVRDRKYYVDGSDIPLAPTEQRWLCYTDDLETAQTVWRYRARVNASIIETGPIFNTAATIEARMHNGNLLISPRTDGKKFTSFLITLAE
jgi:hypothetical protein